MNTENKRDQKKHQGQESRQQQGRKKQGQNPSALHHNLKLQDQERPETRLTR